MRPAERAIQRSAMFQLEPKCVPGWPKLAWVAVLDEGTETVTVYHGPMVEVADDWIVEAVWAGDFAAGDFDRTDLVFGSGVRCRGRRMVFVSSGTTFDCLWRLERAGRCVVSNSLPAVLAFGGAAVFLGESLSEEGDRRVWDGHRRHQAVKSSLQRQPRILRGFVGSPLKAAPVLDPASVSLVR